VLQCCTHKYTERGSHLRVDRAPDRAADGHAALQFVAVMCCTVLQSCIAVFFSVVHVCTLDKLQCVAVCCGALHCIVLHCVAVRCSVLHLCTQTATQCNTLQDAARRCNTLRHTATHCVHRCNTLQRTAGGGAFSCVACVYNW